MLMGTVPLYWGEADGLGELLSGGEYTHWGRAVLERQFNLVPLDFLTTESLGGRDFLLMAQPRALAPTENVALDDWVRRGGRLLLLADPMMTGETRFPPGDRRRPQDVALLSPIFTHWGLELLFDADQQAGLGLREVAGRPVPVNLPGAFVAEEAACVIEGEGLIASCAIGNGRAVLLADAALLDFHNPHTEAAQAVTTLVERAFFQDGDSAGNADASEVTWPESGLNSQDRDVAPNPAPQRNER